MEFRFNVNEVFNQSIAEIGSSLIPAGYKGDRRAMWDALSKVSDIINAMGSASAAAQGLTKPITTADRLRNSSEQKVYLMIDPAAFHGKGAVTGMLKTGTKGLYVFDRDGQNHHIKSPCILDFYVHESRQRSGLGKHLFEYMLQKEAVRPEKMAVDRPSEKLLGFLNKYYGLNSPIRQMNNFVVYDGFFPLTKEESVMNDSNFSKRAANGLQGQVTSPFGRYGAPRPLCSMGQIIHNQSTAVTPQEPSGQQEEQNLPSQQIEQQVPMQDTINHAKCDPNLENPQYYWPFNRPNQMYVGNPTESISKLHLGTVQELLSPESNADNKPVAQKVYVDGNGRPLTSNSQNEEKLQQYSEYDPHFIPQGQYYVYPNQQYNHGHSVENNYPIQNNNIPHLMRASQHNLLQSPSTMVNPVQVTPSQHNIRVPNMSSHPNQIVQQTIPHNQILEQSTIRPTSMNQTNSSTQMQQMRQFQYPQQQMAYNQMKAAQLLHVDQTPNDHQYSQHPVSEHQHLENSASPLINQNYAHGDPKADQIASTSQLKYQENNDGSVEYKNQLESKTVPQQNTEVVNLPQNNHGGIPNVPVVTSEQIPPHYRNIEDQYRKYQLEHFAVKPSQYINEPPQPSTNYHPNYYSESEKYLNAVPYKEPLYPSVSQSTHLNYRTNSKSRSSLKSELINKSQSSIRWNNEKRALQSINPLQRNINAAQKNSRTNTQVGINHPIIEQRSNFLKTGLVNSKGDMQPVVSPKC